MQSMNHYRFNFCSLVVEGSRITTTSIRLVLCFVCPNKTLCLTSNQHLKGAAHRANAICCPYCKKSHTTASGVAHHLEMERLLLEHQGRQPRDDLQPCQQA